MHGSKGFLDSFFHSSGYAERDIVIDDGAETSYSELKSRVVAATDRLLNAGVESGHVVAVHMYEDSDMLVAFFAVLQLQAIIVPLHYRSTSSEIEELVRELNPDFLISDKIFSDVGEKKDFSDKYSIFSNKNAAREEWKQLLKDRNIAMGLYTSGSKGKKKAIFYHLNAVLAHVDTEMEMLHVNAQARVLNVLTLSHDVGFYQCLVALRAGARLYMRRFVLLEWLLVCMREKHITHINGIPSIWRKLIQNAVGSPLSNVRYITISAGSMLKFEIKKLEALFPQAIIIKTYGQTETFRSLFTEANCCDYLCNGRPLAGVTLDIAEGILIHTSENAFYGTMSDKRLSVRQEHEPVVTGDLFEKHGNCYFFRGRKDDLLKVNGFRVSAYEVESKITELTGVSDLMYIEHMGEPVLLVDGDEHQLESIKRNISGKLPAKYSPKMIMKYSLLKTGSGKIDRFKTLLSWKHETISKNKSIL